MTELVTQQVILPEDAVAAIELALNAAASAETAVEVIELICGMAGPFNGSRTEPTKILLDAIRELNGTFAVNQGDT